MSTDAENAVLKALGEWRRLVEAEGQAILTRNWRALRDCHLSLQELQGDLSVQTQAARQIWRQLGPEGQKRHETFRSIILELTDLHHRNKAWLGSRKEQVARQINQLDSTNSNLRRIRHSYASSGQAEWSSLA
jgi:hypothetical protein